MSGRRLAASLNERFRDEFSGNNIVMTVGAAGRLNVILKSLINPGDEVIAFAPYFGEYRSYTNNYDGVLVEISPNTENFQPKLDEFEQKITPRTKAVIVNIQIIRQESFILRRRSGNGSHHGGETERVRNRHLSDL